MNKQQQNEVLQTLTDWGCDVPGALNRLLNSKNFYFRLLAAVLSDPAFDALGEALARRDVHGAFACAHTLKGVLGNLGLTPMCNEACAAVELLRAGKLEGVDMHYAALRKQRTFLADLLKKAATRA